MRIRTIFASALAALAVGGLALMPAGAPAQGKSKDKGKAQSKSHWNPAPPKRNGRHDNRDYNKGDDRWDEDDDRRKHDDWRRWEDEQRRISDRTRSSSDSRYLSTRSVLSEYDRRQRTKNEWRNIAIASGALAVLGILQKDQTLTFVGAAGALYSLHRYEQDRKSQNSLDRLRASYFSRATFYRDGQQYNRRIMIKNGERYYQFVRA